MVRVWSIHWMLVVPQINPMNPPAIKSMVAAVPRSLGSYGPVLREIETALASPQCNLNSIGINTIFLCSTNAR
ncbi:MAG: hypothetical protein RL616_606 [Verrucomicrobiota bacterium]